MKDLATLSQKYFESIRQTTDDGKEYWYARDLMKVLEYDDWRNFNDLIDRAVEAGKKSGISVEDHFVEVTNMIETGKGATRRVKKNDQKALEPAGKLLN